MVHSAHDGVENTAQQLIIKYTPRLSPAMQADLALASSGLLKAIESVPFSDNNIVNKNLLQMIIVFYEAGILEENRHILLGHEFIRQMCSFMWDDLQIRLIPFLNNKRYDPTLIQLILSDPAYYRSYSILVQFGLTQDAPEYLAHSDKREQLNYINKLVDENTRKLCLIFWAKGRYTLNDLQEIVKATNKYPMLAETLIALDQNKDIVTVETLFDLALKPQKHLKKSIVQHFSLQFNAYGLDKSVLKDFDEEELAALSLSLNVLKQTEIISHDAYSRVLKKDKGELLRLFLPSLSQVENIEHRKILIDLLYQGAQCGAAKQGKALLAYNDKDLQNQAKKLNERFVCVKQLQNSLVHKEAIIFAAKENSIRASRFRHLIMKIDKEMKAVHEDLFKNPSHREKLIKWESAHKQYRRALYEFAYLGISQPQLAKTLSLEYAEKSILDIVDPEIKNWLYNSFINIANLIIFTFTLNIANQIKERKTGNYWFFTQTASGEKIRALDNEIMQFIQSPLPEITGV